MSMKFGDVPHCLLDIEGIYRFKADKLQGKLKNTTKFIKQATEIDIAVKLIQ